MKTMLKTRKKPEDDDSDFSLSELEEELDDSEEYEESSDEEDASEISEILEELNPKKSRKQSKKKSLKEPKAEKDKKLLGKKKKPETPIDKQLKQIKPSKASAQAQVDQLTSHIFDLTKDYFYQNVTNSEWLSITQFIEENLSSPFNQSNANRIKDFFNQHPKLSKGQHNLSKLIQILNDKTKSYPSSLCQYQQLTGYILSTYYMAKPAVFDVYFFPNEDNEINVINMLKACKESMDIAIFTMTNSRIAAAIEENYRRGVKVRVIADDECCKMWGSNIYNLASIGIDVKTDDSVRYHMHHKFAVIDKSVVVTGSFNWTTQAVKNNQENILFLENKELARKYSEEFQRLWDDFETVITQESASRIIKEQEDKKKALENRKKKEKELKLRKKQEGNEKVPSKISKPPKAKEENKENKSIESNDLAKNIAEKLKRKAADGTEKSCFIF